ncbi:MAG: hypothetical protein ACT4PV_05150 [Planctomycetaceae bacterium]
MNASLVSSLTCHTFARLTSASASAKEGVRSSAFVKLAIALSSCSAACLALANRKLAQARSSNGSV